MFQKESERVYDDDPVYYVYHIINPTTGLPFYVGKGKGRRCYQHLTDKLHYSRNKRLTGHIRNLRESGITPEIVKISENMPEEAAFILEEEEILKYGRKGFESDGVLMNVFLSIRPERRCGEDNGFYGRHHSEETKKLISEANTGRKHTEETKQKMSESHTGVPKSEETKKKMSEKATGRVHTEETKQKLREHNLQEDVLRRNIESKQKEWIVITPDGTEIEVINMSEYCLENSLNRSKMYSVAAGDRNHHKGYKCRKKNE